MCGIVGYAGRRDCVPLILGGLRRLEYRGYDSAGLAVVNGRGEFDVRRSEGKMENIEALVARQPLEGRMGLGHTRWATHGRPCEENSHPHRDCTGRVAVVHNGIIENYAELKADLSAAGHKFVTETDTEVVAHLIEDRIRDGADLAGALRETARRLEGIFSIVAAHAGSPDRLAAAKQGPPLLLGIGEGERFVASDIPALLPYTRDMLFLEDGEVAQITADSHALWDFAGKSIPRESVRITWDPVMAEKGGYRHFMLKEIFEQPAAVRETLSGRLNLETGEVNLEEANLDEPYVRGLARVHLVACGTSWHAALVGKRYIETLAGVPCEVDYGSEYRHRETLAGPDTLFLGVSQSGETADTLAAVQSARAQGARVLSVCNVQGSMMARKSDGVVYTHAGPEIGVASTKAFTAQLAALYLIALYLGRRRGRLSAADSIRAARELARLPHAMETWLQERTSVVEEAARKYKDVKSFLYLGRGLNYPLALEGALKLKEISYIHAEGYPAGEMKHGPIALIDAQFPTMALVFDDGLRAKMLSNVEEIRARGGPVLAVVDAEREDIRAKADALIVLPKTPAMLTPFMAALPLQLFAYHVAVLRGCDVDQPRNLAKSVTVE
jgi:glucosamine--fructose-6-phosphate aminotransferase (isomerizing)